MIDARNCLDVEAWRAAGGPIEDWGGTRHKAIHRHRRDVPSHRLRAHRGRRLPMRAASPTVGPLPGPTVSRTVARMERDGLLVVAEGDHHLELTDTGRSIATPGSCESTARRARSHGRHRARPRARARGGLSLGTRDERPVEERLLALLDDPLVSPYGNPGPHGSRGVGIAELGMRHRRSCGRREGEIHRSTRPHQARGGGARVVPPRGGGADGAGPSRRRDRSGHPARG